MATNLNLDDKLVEQARTLGNHTTKREAVDAALREYVQHRRRLKSLDAFGTYEFDETWDHKAERADRTSR